MIKLIGSILLFFSCTGLGFRIANDYRNRPKHIRALQHALRLLQTEIEYSVTPLQGALRRVAERVKEPVRSLFEVAARELDDPECPVRDAIQRGVLQTKDRNAMRDGDYDVLLEFAQTLGSSDRFHQTQQFQVTLLHFDALVAESDDSRRRNERLWQYLGVLSGLLLIVLMY